MASGACQTACTCPGCPSCIYSDCGPESCNRTCAGQHTCGANTEYPAYTCDYSVTAGGYGYRECCPL